MNSLQLNSTCPCVAAITRASTKWRSLGSFYTKWSQDQYGYVSNLLISHMTDHIQQENK